MRLSHHFGLTLREAPAGIEAESHRFLLRAGFIRQLGQGLYSYLPLAHRSITRIENILREEMNRIGGQEMTMPVVHPAEIWRRSGRYDAVGPEMARFKDRKNSDLVLAMTHEEVVADLCRTEIRSHRQLPQLVYHIQTKFRDDPRPRAGLIRVREFTMKDSYTLDHDAAGLARQYRAHYEAYFRIFGRCGLPTIAVGSDVGMMGGSQAHEFMYLTPVGEDTLVLCDACGYAANRQIARFSKAPAEPETPLPLERVATPGARTIRELAEFLKVPAARTAKAVFLTAGLDGGAREELVVAIVRGDMDVNETKLANAVGASWLRPAEDEAIRSAGATPGYASPDRAPLGHGGGGRWGPGITEPGGGGERAGRALPERERGTGLRPRTGHRHRGGGGRPFLRGMRRAAPHFPRGRGGQHLPARYPLRGLRRGSLPRRIGSRTPDLDGLLRHRLGTPAGMRRGRTSRQKRPLLADERLSL